MHKTEHLLIEGCRKGNQMAQMQIYDSYCEAMFKIAFRYLNNEEDAKDAMQEAFLKAFDQINSFEPRATFGSWLKRIVINHCLDVLKIKQLQFEVLDIEQIEHADSLEWTVDASVSQEEVLSAIEQLNLKYKLVVTLYLLEGYDHEEISQILQIPVKTSRTHLRRGKLKLHQQLKKQYYEARY